MAGNFIQGAGKQFVLRRNMKKKTTEVTETTDVTGEGQIEARKRTWKTKKQKLSKSYENIIKEIDVAMDEDRTVTIPLDYQSFAIFMRARDANITDKKLKKEVENALKEVAQDADEFHKERLKKAQGVIISKKERLDSEDDESGAIEQLEL